MEKEYPQLNQWLQEGILAAKIGQPERARFLLLDVVEHDQTNEAAWFWLYQVVDRLEDKRICLENLITINPENDWASRELLNYLGPTAPPGNQPARPTAAEAAADRQPKAHPARSAPRPVTLKLVTAFWIGISIILLGGGIMASGEWLVSAMRSRTFPNGITYIQAFELLVAVMFIITGIIGLNVAVGLFVRSMIGFYGSVLLALALLLIGPIVSLIATPPNYLTLVCTGGIGGMIVLLTLASHPGLKEDQQNDN
jgi:hypothetical protein